MPAVSKVGPCKKLVVLGCGGFVGSHLLDYLLDEGSMSIVGFDFDDRKIRRHLDNPNFRLFRNGLNDEEIQDELRDLICEADAVMNLAAICNPSQYNTKPIAVIRSNFLDIYELIEFCAQNKKWLIHFSTSEVYGRTISSYLPDNDYDNPDLYELDEWTTPLVMGPISNQRWSYAAAKQLGERYVYANHTECGLPFTIVRPLNFFGPRMDFIPGRDGEGTPRVLACFMTALLDGKPMQLVDGGHVRRTIVSIHDAIRAIVLMLKKPEKSQNQIFNVGNRTTEVTIEELAHRMRDIYAQVTGNPSYRHHPIVSVSSKEFYGPGYEDCDRRMPKIDRCTNLLGWEPTVDLDEMLTETVTYYYDLYGREAKSA